jgi:hypothetical protein
MWKHVHRATQGRIRGRWEVEMIDIAKVLEIAEHRA